MIAVAFIRLRTRVEVKIVGFDTCLVPPPTATEFQPQVVHNADSDFILDHEDIRQLPVEPSGPQRIIIVDPNQLDINAQPLPGTEDGTFQDVGGLQPYSPRHEYCRLCPSVRKMTSANAPPIHR